jgi:serine/threonine-protein kinase
MAGDRPPGNAGSGGGSGASSGGHAGAPSPGSRSSAAGLSSGGRFTAGAILSGRYRIVGLLGKGGMGEVYRADDLTLDHPVALKFLPQHLAAEPARLDRFLGEVRIARQIAHPNVCRVYDIGEADGDRFISMEYVDGEDLSSLLRRIGRYSKDKAVEIARQICAGLAAAHDRGVLHRDLKPANIMIDGRGRVRITDFGLASLAGQVTGAEIRAGTPAYMAPEQLAGKEVSLQSDIYSLGLVLYELFTGRPAHDAATKEELLRSHTSGSITMPSSHAEEIDPAAERIILKCLERDPRDRPTNALAVAAALPGGDPLAAALAAGETPSPAMVAAAGEQGALRPGVAWALLATGVILSLAAAVIGGWWEILRFVDHPMPPGALEVRARDLVRDLGHEAPVGDTASGFGPDFGPINWIRDREYGQDRWEALREMRPGAMIFWYRQSPGSMLALGNFSVVSRDNPPLDEQGMALVILDSRGELEKFEAIPDRFDESEGPWIEPDWERLFEAAALKLETFTEVAPRWTPTMAVDVRRAWEGPLAGRDGITLHVEAAGFRGRPVSFELFGPWEKPPRMTTDSPGFTEWLGRNLGLAVFALGSLAIGMLFAWRNIRAGRSDTRGALRVAFWFFLLHTAVWAVWASHVADLNSEWGMVQADVGYNLFLAANLWLLYVGLEPYVRRRWPDVIISWSRLLRGKLRDPMIGRDILIGGVLAGILGPLTQLDEVVPLLRGHPIPVLHGVDWSMLMGVRWTFGKIVDDLIHSLLQVMQGLFVLLLFRILFRKLSIACAAFVLLIVLTDGEIASDTAAVSLIQSVAIASVILYVLVRYGLVATTVGLYIETLLDNLAPTGDLTVWYAPSFLLPIATSLALLAWGFHTSLAGQPIFGSAKLLDE